MLDFLLQYVLHPMKVGAIAPSSKYLAKGMLESVINANALWNMAREQGFLQKKL